MTQKSRTLVVNADDFGISKYVNNGIVKSHRDGIVTSTTILATGQAFAHACSLLQNVPKLGVGIHLNLTLGKPVSQSERVPSLVNPAQNRFHTISNFILNLLMGKISISEVKRELRTQISMVKKNGIRISHIDSHQHIHVLPGVNRVVLELAREFGIGKIRNPKESIWTYFRKPQWSIIGNVSFRNAMVVVFFASGYRRRITEAGLRCPENFYGLINTGCWSKESLLTFLRPLKIGIHELMVHPGFTDTSLKFKGVNLIESRQEELNCLVSDQVREIVEREGISLASYDDV